MNFFPSRTLALYMAKMLAVRSLAVLAMLVLVLQALDLLGESGRIVSVEGNGQSELWTYVSLRLPQLVQRFLPFSVLLGTIITAATLNQNSEVISMKAGGLSAHQILAPLILTSLIVAMVSFVFNETVVAPSTARLSAWQRVDYGPIPAASNVRTNVWVRDGNNLVNAKTVTGRGTDVVLQDITIYERVNNSLRSMMHGEEARYSGSSWTMTGVSRYDVLTGEEVFQDQLITGGGLRPDQFTLANVNADGLSFTQLISAIQELEKAGRPTKELETSLWHKISGPLSSVLMPLLGAVAAFGLARSGQLFIRAVIGMALGFAYFVADNFSLAMGTIGAYPPILAAWAPFILFFLIGETVLIRSEE
ncbi:LPS export ABC transporter permease LptG [Parasphingorhabdus sp.]|uniref:LPS export ABC transporter permease LptG n=1 Tax=Parasphingorhabdus sp. TaxID=2709688 RepID=UPI002F929166